MSSVTDLDENQNVMNHGTDDEEKGIPTENTTNTLSTHSHSHSHSPSLSSTSLSTTNKSVQNKEEETTNIIIDPSSFTTQNNNIITPPMKINNNNNNNNINNNKRNNNHNNKNNNEPSSLTNHQQNDFKNSSSTHISKNKTNNDPKNHSLRTSLEIMKKPDNNSVLQPQSKHHHNQNNNNNNNNNNHHNTPQTMNVTTTDEELDRLMDIQDTHLPENSKSSQTIIHPPTNNLNPNHNHTYNRPSTFQCCSKHGNAIRNHLHNCITRNNLKFYKIGNLTVIQPLLYSKTSVGIVGPEWWGPLCTLILLESLSYYYIHRAHNDPRLGHISTVICILFTIVATLSLLKVSCTDPGIVKRQNGGGNIGGGGGNSGHYETVHREEDYGEDWRYCDYCSDYQPPDGAHCPDCNVCVEGYDHHCPWMGTCIGKNNMTSFKIFNMAWMFYFLYANIWIVFLGPRLLTFDMNNNDDTDNDDPNDTFYY